MNKRFLQRGLAALLAAGMSLCLCACSDGGGEASSAPVESQTVRTTLRLIELKIEDLLTKEDIEAVLGVPMQEPIVNRYGTGLDALSANNRLSVKVSLSQQTEEQFAAMVTPDASSTAEAPVEAPNLGSQAWWKGDRNLLLVYQDGYVLSVNVIYDEYSEEDALFVSRNLAAGMLEKFPN